MQAAAVLRDVISPSPAASSTDHSSEQRPCRTSSIVESLHPATTRQARSPARIMTSVAARIRTGLHATPPRFPPEEAPAVKAQERGQDKKKYWWGELQESSQARTGTRLN